MTIGLLSPSGAVQVQLSPASAGAAPAFGTFSCSAQVNGRVSSHWMRSAVTPCAISSCRSAQTLPASIGSFAAVFKLASAGRAVARMGRLSQGMFRIGARVFRGSLFMLSRHELHCLAPGISVIALGDHVPPSGTRPGHQAETTRKQALADEKFPTVYQQFAFFHFACMTK